MGLRLLILLVLFPLTAVAQPKTEDLRAFYEDWKQVYLSNICGAGTVIVDLRSDPHLSDGTGDPVATVSEAHGYGMLALVMMADTDPQAHDLFDGMVRYYLSFPAGSSPHLLAWRQVYDGMTCRLGGEGDENSATDGDLDVAYALLLAHATWGNDGVYDYLALARDLLADAAKYEMMAGGHYLNIGDWVTHFSPELADLTRTSDFFTSHYPAFYRATCDNRWLLLRASTYDIVETVAHPDTGLLPDFIEGLPDRPRAAMGERLETNYDGTYFWNASRTPFRLALDVLIYGQQDAVPVLSNFNHWAQQATGGDPANVAEGYHLDGQKLPYETSSPLVFVSMMGVAAMLPSASPEWRAALWTNILARDINDEVYFGNTLKLLALLAATGHWKTPDQALGDCQSNG